MEPEKIVEAVDKVTIKIALVVSTLIVGFFFSVLVVNAYHELFFNQATRGVPRLALQAMPLVGFIALQIMTAGLQLEVRIFWHSWKARHKITFSERVKEIMQYLESDAIENLSVESQAKIKSTKKKAKKFAASSVKSLEQARVLEKSKHEWYDKPLYAFLGPLIAKFILMSTLVLCLQNSLVSGNILAYLALVWAYLILNYKIWYEVLELVVALTRLYGIIVQIETVFIAIKLLAWYGKRKLRSEHVA